jgi:hypothetical protein
MCLGRAGARESDKLELSYGYTVPFLCHDFRPLLTRLPSLPSARY